MAREIYQKIIALVLKAAELARSIGISNLLQPGLVKEMIIAQILGHELIHSKRDADAHAPGDPAEKYEYLSCKEGGTGQLDRMFKEPDLHPENWSIQNESPPGRLGFPDRRTGPCGRAGFQRSRSRDTGL